MWLPHPRHLDGEPVPVQALVLLAVFELAALSVMIASAAETGIGSLADWGTAAVLTALGIGLARISVEGVSGQRYCSAVAPMMTAVVLLPPATAAASIIFINAIGVRNRHSTTGLLFNISAFVLTCVPLSVVAAHEHTAMALRDGEARGLALVIALSGVFAVVSNIMFAAFRSLGHGYPILSRGLIEVVVADAGLAAFGCLGAYLWMTNKWLALIALLPVGFFYRSQHAARLQKVADQDPKTGLYNARRFSELLATRLRPESGKTHGLLVIDVDHLRETNNRYGHLAGDAVIVGVGEIIERHLREGQYAARFGGEEFLVLAENISEQRLLTMAEAIRNSIASNLFRNDQTGDMFHATASFGAAMFPQHGDTASTLFHAADVAAYRAKAAGRNQVRLAREVEALPSESGERLAGRRRGKSVEVA